MAWDDFDFSGFSLGGGDTPDYGTSFDFGSTPSYDFGGFDPSLQFNTPSYSAPMGMGAAAPGVGGGQASPWMGAGMGALGPLAGLIGNLAGGGAGQRVMPQLTTNQKAMQGQGTQALGMMSPFAMGQSPLQQQQAGVLGALGPYLQAMMSGQGMQGLIGQLSPMIQQAYSPFVQGLMQQATEAGRKSGFYDAPGTSPVGSAILGPGMAQLQGQQAQSLLQAMLQQIPQAAMQGAGAFNQPVNQQIGAAQGMASGYGNLMGPTGTQQSQPMGPQIGQNVATALGGAAQGYLGQQQQNQQQQYQNSMLNAIQGMSGTPWQP